MLSFVGSKFTNRIFRMTKSSKHEANLRIISTVFVLKEKLVWPQCISARVTSTAPPTMLSPPHGTLGRQCRYAEYIVGSFLQMSGKSQLRSSWRVCSPLRHLCFWVSHFKLPYSSGKPKRYVGFYFFLECPISFSFATGESTGNLMIVHNTAHVFCTNSRVNSRKCCHTAKSHQNWLPKFCVFNTDIKGVM